MPRPSNTAQRRSEIVQALNQVMADQGYSKATISAIAKQAGLKSGLIHYHFKTKQEILVELIKQVTETGIARYQSLIGNSTDPQAKLKAFIDARLAKGEGEQPQAVATWVVIGTEAIRQPEVQVEYEKAIQSQKQTLQQLITDISAGRHNQFEIEHITGISLAAIEGAFQLSVATRNLLPSGYAAPTLLELINRYLKN